MKNKLALFLVLGLVSFFESQGRAGIQLSVSVAPPPIAVFDQPTCPGDGYIWTPGYYQYGDYGYYWVPGAWVSPPAAGLLWTPGYWRFVNDKYTWNEGSWGPQVGFYGGINYGNGYFGSGFTGGRWEGGVFQHRRGHISYEEGNEIANRGFGSDSTASVLSDADYHAWHQYIIPG